MQKTKIPWCDYTINPVKGLCPMACSYCYARRMYKRFKWNPERTFDWSVANDLPKMKAGSRVFWCSTMELFGNWVEPDWMYLIMEAVKRERHLTHIFLTKKPENLIKWSPFPENCWVGVSATNDMIASAGCAWLSMIVAKVKFLSIEPLLEWNIRNAHNGRICWQENYHDLNWLIIGSQTQPVKHPSRNVVDDILTAADKAKIPVFVKEPMASHFGIQRQEFPESKKE